MDSRRRGRAGHDQLAFKAFLSHRYKAPEVNLYFSNLFESAAEVQFEVDVGPLSTNVTRLERMVRGADAFIGIYPFPGDEAAPSRDELLRVSRYFRLELDLAVRSRKPTVVFADERYGTLLRPPSNILWCQFNAAEITGMGQSPAADLYRQTFKRLCEQVTRRKAYEITRPVARSGVGLVVLDKGSRDNGYAASHLTAIETILHAHGFDDLRSLRWPPVLSRDALALFEEVDWVIADVGARMGATGIPGYLHGRFMPMLRLKRVPPLGTAPLSVLQESLLGGVEVGYATDVLAWHDVPSLMDGLAQRLTSLRAGVKRVNTAAEATAYFRSAARRPKALFLSYSGGDESRAAPLSVALKKRFAKVFDYKDGESIEPGQPWLAAIFDQLATSAVGISLVSQSYIDSRNCLHEAQEMVAQVDAKKMRMIPIRLPGDSVEFPSWLRHLQYMRWENDKDAEEVASQIAGLVED